MSDKTKTTIHIFGQDYVVKGNESEEYISMLADYVDKKMGQISENASALPPVKVAVLTALNIADELSKLQEDYDSLVKLIDEEKRT